jgi:hypothetical protein
VVPPATGTVEWHDTSVEQHQSNVTTIFWIILSTRMNLSIDEYLRVTASSATCLFGNSNCLGMTTQKRRHMHSLHTLPITVPMNNPMVFRMEPRAGSLIRATRRSTKRRNLDIRYLSQACNQ